MAQHAALPEEITLETIAAERMAENYYRISGTTLPEWGQHRAPSVMAVTEAEAA